MDKSAIDTPSREIDLRNIPVHLRTALRRALEFEARAPAPRSAEEAEQCEEQLRAIADEFFGALLTPVLQRAVCSAAVGDAASALVRHLPRRMRSDGLETVNVRTSRGTTVPVTTPYYREKHARRAKRRPGLYPALVVLGIYDRCTPKLASDASRAVAMLSSLAEAQAQLRSDGIALDWSCPSSVDTYPLGEEEESTMPKSRPPYPAAFRQQMVELVRSGRTPGELAREFEPSAEAIRNWVAQADRDAGKRSDGLRTEEHEEIRRLRRENRQLREEREILAKATAWFARETGPGRSTGS